jgi:hypothetical protein
MQKFPPVRVRRGAADRIYVLFDGRIMAELAASETNEDEIMYYAVGSTTPYVNGREFLHEDLVG